jgi:hypothetical protein
MMRGNGSGRQRRAGKAAMLWAWLANLVLIFPVFPARGAAGNNRLPCFLDDLDRQRYLQCLWQARGRFACRLHAYVAIARALSLTPFEVYGLTTATRSLVPVSGWGYATSLRVPADRRRR